MTHKPNGHQLNNRKLREDNEIEYFWVHCIAYVIIKINHKINPRRLIRTQSRGHEILIYEEKKKSPLHCKKIFSRL